MRSLSPLTTYVSTPHWWRCFRFVPGKQGNARSDEVVPFMRFSNDWKRWSAWRKRKMYDSSAHGVHPLSDGSDKGCLKINWVEQQCKCIVKTFAPMPPLQLRSSGRSGHDITLLLFPNNERYGNDASQSKRGGNFRNWAFDPETIDANDSCFNFCSSHWEPDNSCIKYFR